MQLRRQAVESCGDTSPVVQPIAWKADGHLSTVQCALADAGAANGADLARAAGKKLFGTISNIDQVFAVIGRAAAERQDGEAVRTGARLGRDIAWVNRPQALERRQHAAQSGNRHE